MKAQVKSSLLLKLTKPELLCMVKNKKTNCTKLLWHHLFLKDENCNMQSGTFTKIQNLTYCSLTDPYHPKASRTKMYLYQNHVCTKPDINFQLHLWKMPLASITSSSVIVKNSVTHLIDPDAWLLKEKGKNINYYNLVMLIGLLWSTVDTFSKLVTCLLG